MLHGVGWLLQLKDIVRRRKRKGEKIIMPPSFPSSAHPSLFSAAAAAVLDGKDELNSNHAIYSIHGN